MAQAFAFRLVPGQPDIAQEPRVEVQKGGALPLPVLPAQEAIKQRRRPGTPGGD
jgi:hypothetical protein